MSWKAASPAAPGTLGTVSEGWVEVRWTEQAQALLDRFQAAVEAVAPAQLVQDAQGWAIRFPVRSGQGDLSAADPPKAHGDGRLDGGADIRTSDGNVRVTGLGGALQDGPASGKCVVNGVDVGIGRRRAPPSRRALMRPYRVSEYTHPVAEGRW